MPQRWKLVPAAISVLIACVCLIAPAGATAVTGTSPANFTSSQVTAPAPGAELFYDADTGSGSVTVTGTVGPANYTGTGDLLCYTAPGHAPFTVATAIKVTSGGFSSDVSLAAIASTACQLRFVPHGTTPSDTAATAFTGPQVSVSEQLTRSASGNVYDYYVLSGTLDWSFALGSLGACPVEASYATDPSTLGSYLLFDGNACVLQSSGIAPDQGTRSGVQVDGLNAYPPAALAGLTGTAGFSPLGYTAAFDANHDTVTITESDDLDDCASPGGFPPTTTSCPSLTPSGVDVSQTTTLEPGGQVTRVSQTFTSADGNPHALDLLFSQSIAAPASGETPAFEFPGQPVFASHAAPDSFALFPGGPGSIYAIADAGAAPSVANPTGAITYQQPPTSADFVSATGAQTATFLMHYAETIPAGGSWTLNWSFSQAADPATLKGEVDVELDRWNTPTVTLVSPTAATTKRSPVTVDGTATDPVGISSVSVDGALAIVSSSGTFSVPVTLRSGLNTIAVIATNVAGNTTSVTRQIRYAPPPCVVPRLRGRSLAAAKKLLADHGCRTGRVVTVRSKLVRPGKVIKSSPRAGARRAHGAKIRVFVSRAPAKRRDGDLAHVAI